jgi:hypothetical protein
MSFKRLFNIAILFIFIIVLQSCTSEKRNLTSSEKDWVNHFEVGDMSFYKNAAGKVDTLIVTVVNNYYTPRNRAELSEFQNEIYLVSFKFKSKNNYNGDESFISVTAEEWEKRIPYIFFGNLGPRKINSENLVPVTIDTVLRGIELSDVYYYSADINAEQYGENKYFINFFWSKQEGLVAYTTVDDGVFVNDKAR